KRTLVAALVALAAAAALAGRAGAITVSPAVDVSRDQLSQNEEPRAIDTANNMNMITGANDWNYNDGCAVNATTDGGATWTPTLPYGCLRGPTKFTTEPNR